MERSAALMWGESVCDQVTVDQKMTHRDSVNGQYGGLSMSGMGAASSGAALAWRTIRCWLFTDCAPCASVGSSQSLQRT